MIGTFLQYNYHKFPHKALPIVAQLLLDEHKANMALKTIACIASVPLKANTVCLPLDLLNLKSILKKRPILQKGDHLIHLTRTDMCVIYLNWNLIITTGCYQIFNDYDPGGRPCPELVAKVANESAWEFLLLGTCFMEKTSKLDYSFLISPRYHCIL